MNKSYPFLTYRHYMIQQYGEVLQRIPIDIGANCPHRDKEGRGCAFCAENGARAIQTRNASDIAQQIETARIFARNRYRAKQFMAYFQAFSATYQLSEQRKQLIIKCLKNQGFTAISVGTRPDCLNDDAIAFMQSLQDFGDVWVELGVQTSCDETLRRIHRGHSWACSRDAIQRLHQAGLHVAVHVMVGLPGETQTDNMATMAALAVLPIDGIKFHNVHVIKNTELASWYDREPFPVLSEYDYAEILMELLRRTPAHWPIMRLNTDTPPDELIAPLWHMKKGSFIDYVTAQMIYRDWYQGERLPGSPEMATPADPFDDKTTDDGSLTLWNSEYKEHYHTAAGAWNEAQHKFLHPSGIAEQLKHADTQVLDVCFGLGYNALACCDMAEKLQMHHLHIQALEMDRRVIRHTANALKNYPADPLYRFQSSLHALYSNARCHGNHWDIHMHWGDARHTASHLPHHHFDIIFLDAFSTQRNAELWTLDFLRELTATLKTTGILLTYCAALPVRSALLQLGFHVGETKPFGRQRGGTIASNDAARITNPVSDAERQVLNSPRGLPYRDPFLVWSSKDILKERQKESEKQKQGSAS